MRDLDPVVCRPQHRLVKCFEDVRWQTPGSALRGWVCVMIPGIVAAAAMLIPWAGHLRGYSYHFHADELGKINQVLSGERNFNHPLLLLELASVAARISGADDNLHAIAVAGRTVALMCAAGAAGLLTIWVGLLRGPLLSWCVSVWLAFHPQLITYGHTFKEDTPLVFGLSLTLVALGGAQRSLPANVWPALAGFGAGLAASGKYIGFLWLALLFAVVPFAARPGRRTVSTGLALAGACVVFLVINFRMIVEWPAPWIALTGEVDRATNHIALTSSSRLEFFTRFFSRPQKTLVPVGVIGGLVLLTMRFVRPGRHSGGVDLAVAFAIIYIGLLVKSGKMADRYWLPVLVLTGPLGWVALSDLAALFRARLVPQGRPLGWARAGVGLAIAVCAVYLVGLGVQRGIRAGKQFRSFEDRLAVANFIRANLPAEASIGYGRRVGLPDPAYMEQYQCLSGTVSMLPQRVEFVADSDDVIRLEFLRQRGFTHVVVNTDVIDLRVRRRDRQDQLGEFRKGTKLLFEGKSDMKSAFPARLAIYELVE